MKLDDMMNAFALHTMVNQWTSRPLRRTISPITASERRRLRIERLLDEVEAAVGQYDWEAVLVADRSILPGRRPGYTVRFSGMSATRYRFEDWEEAQEYFLENGLTDGLPIVVPTEDRVKAMLEYSGLGSDQVIGVEGIRRKQFTAEKVAINAVMAGCKPEYFPVVVAAVAACCERPFNLHANSTSTNGIATLVLVSGPYAQEIEMNSKAGLMGNGNRANTTIGRAVNLVKTNFYGSTPQGMDKSAFGQPGKISFCFAEDPDVGSWPSLAATKGFPEGTTTVTVFAANSPLQVTIKGGGLSWLNWGGKDPQDFLSGAARAMLALGPFTSEVLVVISPELMAYVKAVGWGRQEIQTYLYERTLRPATEWIAWHQMEPTGEVSHPDETIGCVADPDRITVVAGGGDATAYLDLISSWASSRSVTKEIQISR